VAVVLAGLTPCFPATGVTDIPDAAFHQVGNHWQFNLVTTNLEAGYTYTFEIPLKIGSIQFTVAVKQRQR
jgi:hypothetical protein